MPADTMARVGQRRQVTQRDREILTALDYTPLTTRQLKYLSTTWSLPFSSLRKARERLQELAQIGLVRTDRYAALAPGQPENYYRLTLSGFRLLRGPDELPPTKSYCSPIGISRQAHTKALADFLVHTIVSAHQSGLTLSGYYRENTLRLAAGAESVYPDAAFVLVTPDRTHYRFFVEIDFGTERLRSSISDATWERKVRVYDRVQDEHGQSRFRVLVISANNSHTRLDNMLSTAASQQRNSNRTLFLAATLVGFAATRLAVTAEVFRDHRGHRQSLVPQGLFDTQAAAAPLLQAAVA